MSQQINLVDPALLPTTPQFTLNSLVKALAVIILALVLLAVFMNLQLSSLEKETLASNARVKAAQERVDRLNAVLAKRQPNALLATQIAEARREQQALNRISDLLASGGEPGSANGYSALLRGLGQNTVDGVWLTALDLRGDGAGLQGMALHSERIPRFIDALTRVDGLKGKEFAVFEVEKSPETGGAGAVRFSIDSSNKGQTRP